MLRDLRYAFRVLCKSPAFTLAAVVTLALGIGANTAIFSVVDAVLLRALPYPQPEKLAQFASRFHTPGGESVQTSQTGRAWTIVRDHFRGGDAAVYSGWSAGVNFVASGRAEYVQLQRVGSGFFRVLGVHPAIGREFDADEDRPGGPPAAILGHAIWKRHFNADPGVLGQAVNLRGEPHTVVGVMPADFQSSAKADLWAPLKASTTGEGGGSNFGILVRVAPDLTWAQSESQAAALGAELFKNSKFSPGVTARSTLIPLQESMTQGIARPLTILWGAVALVLLIACVNIAGLLLARASSRRKEIATRMALGGGRRQVIRQLLAESLLIGVVGGILGAGLGYLGVQGLMSLGRGNFGIWQEVGVDWRVLAVTAALSLGTAILFGLAPALQASRVDLHAALVEGGTRGIAGGSGRWPRRLLVAGEVAMGMMLLTGAGLLIRTFAHLKGLNPGFDASNVITARLSLQDARYRTPENVNRLFDQTLARIRELPAVESAAVVLGLPYERVLNMGFRIPGSTESRNLITNLCYTTPEYFQTLRMKILRGRALLASDRAGSQPVIVVNEEFARTYFKDKDPIGAHLVMSGTEWEIVGLTNNVQQRPGWGNLGPLAPVPVTYIPASQTSESFLTLVHTWFSPSWVVRTKGSVEGVVNGIQQSVESADPLLPLAGFRSMSEVQSGSLGFQRFMVILLGGLSAMAVLLAAVGIYGLIATSVAERTRELGIRMALGATAGKTVRAIAREGIVLAVAGVAGGALAARATVQVMKNLIWGVGVADPVTFAGVALALVVVAGLASILPALRVLRMDPADTLRQE